MPEIDNNISINKMTCRQKILSLLETGPHTCRELSQSVHQSEKEILDHLEHLRITLQARGMVLLINPARCRHCEFVFENRTRLTKPGKCPRCRQTGIEPPVYSIVEGK